MIDFHNSVGTMVLRSDGSGYIIGASDKENEEFQKKNQCRINIDLKDTVELTSVKKTVYTSETYGNFNTVTGMPKHCFSDDYGAKVQQSIKSMLQEYCNGNMTDEELKNNFIDVCKDMRVYQAQSRHTSGVNANDNRQIIENVYEIFQKANVKCLVDVCFQAGSDLAAGNGGNKDDWVYYSTEYYNRSEDLRNLLQNASKEIAEEWNVDLIDFEQIEKGSRFTIDGGLDFNSVWNWRANQRGICSMAEDWKPQEDFTFFYQANKNKNVSGEVTLDSQAGICIVGYEKNKWTLEVPFNGSTLLGKLADHFNAKSLFADNYKDSNSNLLSYLGKFDIYTRFYGHNKMINET